MRKSHNQPVTFFFSSAFWVKSGLMLFGDAHLWFSFNISNHKQMNTYHWMKHSGSSQRQELLLLISFSALRSPYAFLFNLCLCFASQCCCCPLPTVPCDGNISALSLVLSLAVHRLCEPDLSQGILSSTGTCLLCHLWASQQPAVILRRLQQPFLLSSLCHSFPFVVPPPRAMSSRFVTAQELGCVLQSLLVQRLLASSTEATLWWAGKRRWSCMARPPEMAGQGEQE